MRRTLLQRNPEGKSTDKDSDEDDSLVYSFATTASCKLRAYFEGVEAFKR